MKRIPPEQIVGLAPFNISALDNAILSGIWELNGRGAIYHFISNPAHFVTILRNSSLSLCRCDKFKDVADGLLPDINRAAEAETMTNLYDHLESTTTIDNKKVKFERDPKEEFENQRIARMITYIHCWFSGDEPTAKMWKEYGNEFKGLCIQSSVQDLHKAIPKQAPFSNMLIGRVTYSDCTKPVGTFYSFLPLFHKHMRYEHELEVRLVAKVEPDPQTGEYRVENERMNLNLNTQGFIHKIILGKGMPHGTEMEIRRLVTEVLGDVPVVRLEE